MQTDGAGVELSLSEQIHLVFPKMSRGKTIGWFAEMAAETLYGMQVVTNRRRGVITTLEFFQHPLSKIGHVSLLVRPTLYRLLMTPSVRPRVASAAPAGFVQTPQCLRIG